MEEIYKKLEKKHPSEFSSKVFKTNVIDIKETKKDKIEFTIEVSFNAHTKTPDIENNAKYEVKLYYAGELKKKLESPEINGKKDKNATKVPVYIVKKAGKFKNSTVEAKDILTSESEYMNNLASDAIVAWYKELPQNLDAQYEYYVNNIISFPSVSGMGVKLQQNGKTFTAIGNPIEIIYKPIIPEESKHLYTKPSGTINITPSFTIVFNDDLTSIKDFDIKYTHSTPRVETDSAKVAHYEAARSAMNDFSNTLSEYVNDNDNNTEIREALVAMFVDSKNDEVAVSHRNKYDNKEKIDHRKAEKYLQRLKGNNLTFGIPAFIDGDNQELGLNYDPNLNTVMFEVNQFYDGKNYKDETRKIVVLKQQDNGSYLIEKIIVVPESTILK